MFIESLWWDVGGGANSQQVGKALDIVLSDEQVRAVLVNIFGGITRCDIVAEGIIQALSKRDELTFNY